MSPTLPNQNQIKIGRVGIRHLVAKNCILNAQGGRAG